MCLNQPCSFFQLGEEKLFYKAEEDFCRVYCLWVSILRCHNQHVYEFQFKGNVHMTLVIVECGASPQTRGNLTPQSSAQLFMTMCCLWHHGTPLLCVTWPTFTRKYTSAISGPINGIVSTVVNTALCWLAVYETMQCVDMQNINAVDVPFNH